MRKLFMTTLASAAALGLAACGSEDVENTPVDDIDEIVDNDLAEDGYPQAGELNETQQANFDAMDRAAVGEEYTANRDAMMTEMESGGDMADGSTADGSGSSGSDMADGSSDTSGDTTSGNADDMSGGDSMAGSSSMPSRSQMSFAYLDRNDDGQLSVAEYAIWALPTSPTGSAPNDAIAPELTQSQINEAGQTFFYFDDDGDSYLSQSEFQSARDSSRAP